MAWKGVHQHSCTIARTDNAIQQALEFLLRHIEMLLFLTVLAEQIGLPTPAITVLLAAGAVVPDGQAQILLAR